MSQNPVEQILSVLPQTQCGKCDFPGCRPYAEAIASGKANINRCPPGGLTTLKKLAELTQKDVTPDLIEELTPKLKSPQVAQIREAECIGCTKCIQACPVDAIYGAAKLMHVVIQHDCTGCELCIEPCPMDCIDLIPVDILDYDKHKAQARYETKLERGAFKRAGMLEVVEEKVESVTDNRKKLIAESIARAKAKRLS